MENPQPKTLTLDSSSRTEIPDSEDNYRPFLDEHAENAENRLLNPSSRRKAENRIAVITEELEFCDETREKLKKELAKIEETRDKLSKERRDLLSQLAKIPEPCVRPRKRKRAQATLLRVNNLHPAFGDDGLRRLFSPFGIILMARVFDDDNYGLVLFTDPQQANRAIAAIDGLHFDGWPSPIAVVVSTF